MTPFHDLQDYIAIPRVEALRLSPDGRRLVAVVKALSPDGKKYATALWEIDPGGAGRPAPPDPVGAGQGESRLPPGRHAAVRLGASRPPGRAGRPGGPGALGAARVRRRGRPGRRSSRQDRPLTVARDAGTIAFAAATLPGDAAADRERRNKRADAGITAILHEDYPVRHWDHELGPDQPRLFILRPDARDLAGQACRTRGMSPRGRPGPGGAAGRADPGRLDGHHRLVGRCPGGGAALRAGRDRPGDRPAPYAAGTRGCRLRRSGGRARRPFRRLRRRGARHARRGAAAQAVARPARPDPAARAAHGV